MLVAAGAAALIASAGAAGAAAPPAEPAPPPPTTIAGVGVTASTLPPAPAETSAAPATAPRGAPEVTLPPTVPLPVLGPIDDPDPDSARLIPVPPACAAPAGEQAVFVGTLVVHDAATARFIVGRVRSGSVDGFAVNGLIDVRYGPEVRFLDAGTSYIVGAAVDPETGVLSSKVSRPAALFGGSEVAGVDASDSRCPVVDDPVRTLMIDGRGVDTGVLRPLRSAKGEILRALLQPLGVAVLVLIGLVALKLLVFAVARSIRDIGSRRGDDAFS